MKPTDQDYLEASAIVLKWAARRDPQEQLIEQIAIALSDTRACYGTPRLLTVSEVAKRLGVNRDKVLGWIAYKRLEAINVAQGALGRPRYRVRERALDDFLLGRTSK